MKSFIRLSHRKLNYWRRKVIQVFLWLSRSWPLLIPLALITLHCLVLSNWQFPPSKIHSLVSLILQMLGGILVIYSLDQNIFLFKKEGLMREFSSYLSSFPLFNDHHMEAASGISLNLVVSDADLRVRRNPDTMEEKISYLQEQIEELHNKIDNKYSELKESVKSSENKLSDKISEVDRSISEVGNKLKDFAIGGLKLQLLGILMIFHGSIAGYLASTV